MNLDASPSVQKPTRHKGNEYAQKKYKERVNEQNKKIADMIRDEKLKRGLCK
jgi:uncharacterized protein YajQ (UPF0234 family)